MNYPSRKARSRSETFRTKKTQLLIITNFWLLYFILIGFIPLTNNTFSFFSDTETITNSFSAADSFCEDKTYAKDHIDECKDNSGIGNGPEAGDGGEGKTDPDNPKHGNDDDHPKPPKSSESQDDTLAKNQVNNEKSTDSINLETVLQNSNNEIDAQTPKNNGDNEK
jgi:hypothetical protein